MAKAIVELEVSDIFISLSSTEMNELINLLLNNFEYRARIIKHLKDDIYVR
jgi:hypothetical protein